MEERKPIIKKSKGQTDQEIVGMSPGQFKKKFGWKPDDKIEQRYFATHGERLTDPKVREGLEADAQRRRDAAKGRSG